MSDKMKEVAPGIFEKNPTTYFIKCALSSKLCYCSKERLDKLAKKYGGLEKVSENYISRDAKKLKKVGTSTKALAKMDPKDLSDEAKMVREEKKKAREARRERRELENKVRSVRPHDEILPALTEDQIKDHTSRGGCLRTAYFSDWGYCNLCHYKEGCQAECKIMKLTLAPEDVDVARKVLAKSKHCSLVHGEKV